MNHDDERDHDEERYNRETLRAGDGEQAPEGAGFGSAIHREIIAEARRLSAPVGDDGLYTDPVTGIRLACLMEAHATQARVTYTRYARGQGLPWLAIGQAQGISATTEQYLAGQAYERVADITQPQWFAREPVFAFQCGTCRQVITDRGPYNPHPADQEQGHAPDCQRHTAAIAAYDAQIAAEDHQDCEPAQ